jgi:hypothetical protein
MPAQPVDVFRDCPLDSVLGVGAGVMFSLPATSSGCSTRSVGWLATPVIRIFPAAEFHVAPDFVFMLATDVAGFDPQSQFLSLDC